MVAQVAKREDAARARRRERDRERYARDRGKRLARQTHYNATRRIFRRYGVSGEQYEAVAAALDNRCAICRGECRRKLSIDHNHATGEYRGLLCSACNTGLGNFVDDPERLRRAAAYLEAGGDPSFDIVTFARLMEAT